MIFSNREREREREHVMIYIYIRQSHFLRPSLYVKPHIRARCPHHTDHVIHGFAMGRGFKELFVPKGI